MNFKCRLAKWLAVLGGGRGVVIVLTVWGGQINLMEVLRGHLPLSIAIRLSSNSFIFLAILLFLCLIGSCIALWRKFPQVWTGVIWLGIGIVLAYAVHVSRFSIGPLLIPSTALFIIAGGLALWTTAQQALAADRSSRGGLS